MTNSNSIHGRPLLALSFYLYSYALLTHSIVLSASPYYRSGSYAIPFSTSFVRTLEDHDDFAELNNLLQPSVLHLPNLSFDLDVGNAAFTDVRCTSFRIGDVTVSSSKVDVDEDENVEDCVSVEVNVVDLDMECVFDYSYRTALIFAGRGSGAVVSTGNDVRTRLTVYYPPDDASPPPDSIVVDRCEADISIDSVDFQGGMAAWIANAMEDRLRPLMASAAEEKLCRTLNDWGSGASVNDGLDQLQTLAARYPMTYTNDPLTREESLHPPDSVTLLNLRKDGESGGGVAEYVLRGLEEAVDYLRAEAYDSENAVLDGRIDRNINVLVRNRLLDADGAFTLQPDQLSFLEKGGTLWQGTDQVTTTSVTLESIKIKGLDTFTQFDPFVYIGDYTVQNTISLDYLEVECDATFVILPSDREDSVLHHPDPDFALVENATLSLRLDNVTAALSLLLAVDGNLLEAVEIGSLLQTDSISPCLLSTVYDVAVVGLSVGTDDIEPPALTGFVSPGLDRVFDGLSKAAFAILKEFALARLPVFFDITVRGYLNSNFERYRAKYAKNRACSLVDGKFKNGTREDGTVDLRDLLLSPENAAEAGASGKSPYGNLFSSVVMPMINDKLISLDADGLPFLNDRAIRPLTSMQSGKEGMLRFGTELIAIEAGSLLSSSSIVQLRVSNFTVENLDIVTDPVTFLDPISPHSLNNRFILGPVAKKPLILSSHIILAVSGEDFSSEMYNNLELKLSLPSLELLFDLFASIGEDRLLSFPLGDVDNVHCWLNTVRPDTIQDEYNIPLNLARLNVTLSDLHLASNCVDCSSSGLLALNDILAHIQNTGLSLGLRLRFERLVEEISGRLWKKIDLTSLLLEAPSRCSHSLVYDVNSSITQASTSTVSESSALSLDAMETIIGTCVLAAETLFVVASKSHRSDAVGFADPLSEQRELDSDGSSDRYVNFLNINAIFGETIMKGLAKALDYLEMR